MQEIQAYNNQTELQLQLERFCPGLPVFEKKMIETWYGTRVGKMKEDEFKESINQILAEICLLTGLETYPANDNNGNLNPMFVAQVKIIRKFILEGYYFLTPKEILNAFYLNLQGVFGQVIKQYGIKQINCEFIGQVLSAYKEYKSGYINTNPDIQNFIAPTKPLQSIEQATDPVNENRAMIERQFYYFCTNPKWNYRLMLEDCYTTLVHDGLLSSVFYKRFLKNARTLLLQEKQKEGMKPTSTEKVKAHDGDGNSITQILRRFDNKQQIESELHQIRIGFDGKVDRLAKQMAVAGYFKYQLKRGFKNIYVKDDSL